MIRIFDFIRSRKAEIREIIEPFNFDRESSRASLYTDIFIILCIIASCFLIPAENIWPEYEEIFWELEKAFTFFFIIEYLSRWYVALDRLRYPFDIYSIIDLVAILPTIIMMFGDIIISDALRTIRLLRLLRVLRLLRLLKYIRYGFLIYKSMLDLKIWFNTIREQNRLGQLERVFIFGIVAWIIGANTLYFTENYFAEGRGAYANYWQSYWHIVIVLFSGIEDKEPLSLLGRFEISILLLAGICFAGIITGEIVSILVRNLQRAGKVTILPKKINLEQHIVIIGQNNLLDNVIKQINSALRWRHYILLVSREAENININRKRDYKKVFALSGDVLNSSTLRKIKLSKASRIIVLASFGRKGDTSKEIDNRTMMKTLALVGKESNVPIVVELKEEKLLKSASIIKGAEFVVSRLFGEKLASQAVLNPGVTEIYDSLMTFSDNTSEFYTIPVVPELVGKSFKIAQLYFLNYDDEALVLVGIDRSPHHAPNTDFILCPVSPKSCADKESLILKDDDKLILIAFELPEFAHIDKEDIWKGKVFSRT